MYAIIATGGKQYKVTTGDVVKFEKLPGEVGDKVVFDQVLLVSEDGITVGNPYIETAAVEGEILEQKKDKKVIVYKYKPKKGYHKKNGHRQPITVIKIGDVILNGVALEPDVQEEPVIEEAKEDVKAAETVEENTEAAETAEETTEAVEETTEAAEEAVEETSEAAETDAKEDENN